MKSPLKVVLLGDVSLNGRFGKSPFQDWDILEFNTLQYVESSDLTIFNLETQVKSGVENILKNPRLRTSEQAIAKLPKGMNTVACLANNHAYDCLEPGFERTVSALKNNGILYVGAGLSRKDAQEPLLLAVGSYQVGVLAYNHPTTNPCLPEGTNFSINTLEEDRAIREVEQLAKFSDFVIVSLHWGVDYFYHPAPDQIRLAHRLVSAGADIVFGHHAHVIQGMQRIEKSLVFYGLGNTCFYPEQDIEFYKPNRISLGVVLWVTGTKGVEIEDMLLQERSVDGMRAFPARPGWRRKFYWLNRVLLLDRRHYRIFFITALHVNSWLIRPMRFLFNDRYTIIQQLSKLSLSRVFRHYFPK
jgi:poly-gamma-glutamate synthesis protein (capsule biosynthesis protein)